MHNTSTIERECLDIRGCLDIVVLPRSCLASSSRARKSTPGNKPACSIPEDKSSSTPSTPEQDSSHRDYPQHHDQTKALQAQHRGVFPFILSLLAIYLLALGDNISRMAGASRDQYDDNTDAISQTTPTYTLFRSPFQICIAE